MIWLLCWADVLDGYARAMAKPLRRAGSPGKAAIPIPPRRKPMLRLVTVDGVPIQQAAHR